MSWARSPTERRIDPSLFYNNFISLAYVRPGIHTLVLHSFFFTLKKKAGGHTYSSALKKKGFSCVKLQSNGAKKDTLLEEEN